MHLTIESLSNHENFFNNDILNPFELDSKEAGLLLTISPWGTYHFYPSHSRKEVIDIAFQAGFINQTYNNIPLIKRMQFKRDQLGKYSSIGEIEKMLHAKIMHYRENDISEMKTNFSKEILKQGRIDIEKVNAIGKAINQIIQLTEDLTITPLTTMMSEKSFCSQLHGQPEPYWVRIKGKMLHRLLDKPEAAFIMGDCSKEILNVLAEAAVLFELDLFNSDLRSLRENVIKNISLEAAIEKNAVAIQKIHAEFEKIEIKNPTSLSQNLSQSMANSILKSETDSNSPIQHLQTSKPDEGCSLI